MASRSIITGIDIGTTTTRVVVCETSNDDGALPRIIGTGFAPSFGLRHGYVVDPHEAVKGVKAALAIAEKAAGVPLRRARISIGGISLESMLSHGTVMISRADGEISPLDIEKVIEASEDALSGTGNKETLRTVPLRYRLDGKEVHGRPQGLKGSKLEVKTFFITCLKQHMNDLVGVVEEAGISVDDVLPAPVAAARIALTKHQRVAGCVLANIGAETVSLVVFENNMPISLQVFPVGSVNITNDIALGLRIPIEDAERLKLGDYSGGAYPRKKLDEIVDARLSEIFELIEAHLKKIGKNGLLPAGIILTGGGAGIATIEDLARGVLKLPSSIALPALPGNQKTTIKDSSWFVAYGLCASSRPDQENGARGGIRAEVAGIGERIKEWFSQYLP